MMLQPSRGQSQLLSLLLYILISIIGIGNVSCTVLPSSSTASLNQPTHRNLTDNAIKYVRPSASLHLFPPQPATDTSSAGFPRFYPRKFDIPNTSTTLSLSLGRSIDRLELSQYLAILADEVEREIARSGIGAVAGHYEYEWHEWPGYDKMAFFVFGAGNRLTYGVLREVVEGLRLYLDEGRRYRAANFKVERVVNNERVFAGMGRLYAWND